MITSGLSTGDYEPAAITAALRWRDGSIAAPNKDLMNADIYAKRLAFRNRVSQNKQST
jgi:hypothetical protein